MAQTAPRRVDNAQSSMAHSTPPKSSSAPPSGQPLTPDEPKPKKKVAIKKNPVSAEKTKSPQTPSRVPASKPTAKGGKMISPYTFSRIPLSKAMTKTNGTPEPNSSSSTPQSKESPYVPLTPASLRRMKAERIKASSRSGSITPMRILRRSKPSEERNLLEERVLPEDAVAEGHGGARDDVDGREGIEIPLMDGAKVKLGDGGFSIIFK